MRDTVKGRRLYKSLLRWFTEKRKKNIPFSYRFTGLESKHFCWNFAYLVQELLKVNTLSKGSVLKLHSLMFVGVKLRDAVSLYSRVEINTEQLKNLQILSQQFFNVFYLFLDGINPTIGTVAVAIQYHKSQLKEKLGYGLGLNSMQERETKHVKLAHYVQNTCRASGKVRGCDPALSTKNRTVSHHSLFHALCRTFRVYSLKKPISYKISFENRNKCDELCVYKMI